VSDKEIDKLAERSALPAECEWQVGEFSAAKGEGSAMRCAAAFIGLPHVEGCDRETEQLARIGGQNVRTPLRSSPKERPPEGPLTPSEWRRRVWDRQREKPGLPALCAVTGEPLSWNADEVHHPLDKRLLRAKGLSHRIWDERNGMAVKRQVHLDHTSRMRPIPRRFVPASAFEFAREIGLWAIARLNEDHPE
jgi:hypothetical protein